jgi:cobalt-zinc-cadmium efflux system outer membrane protein
VEYDQRSTYVNNYVGLGISLPIPILNTNKGNIRAAGLAVSQAEIQAHALQHQSDQEVMAAYEKFLIAARIKKQEPPDLIQNYDRLLQNMIHSYEQKKVSLLEFIDFFDAYKDSKTRQLRQLTNLYNAAAEINFTVGVRFLAIQ